MTAACVHAVSTFKVVQASANGARRDRTCDGFEQVCKTADIRGQLDGRVLDRLTSLRRIHTKGTRVSGSIPEEVASHVRLETLELSNNILTAKVP